MTKQLTYSNKKYSGNKSKRIRRNRSAYNFFFKHQRSVILQELSDSRNNNGNGHKTIASINNETTYELLRSTLLNGSDGVDKPKRKHRKTHGMINLKDLTGQIAKRWRRANPETQRIYQMLAIEDSLRYRNEIRAANGNAKGHTSCSKGRDTGVSGTKEKNSKENKNENENDDLNKSHEGGKEVHEFSISDGSMALVPSSVLSFVAGSHSTLGYDKDLSLHSGNAYATPRPIEDMIVHEENREYLSIHDFGYFMRILSGSK